MNNMGTQWRTLQPQSPSEVGFLSNGSGGAFQRPARQITKNPQNMFQNFPPTTQNHGGSNGSGGPMNYSNFGSYGNGGASGNGGGLLSPGGLSGISSRMTGGSAFDFGGSRPEQQQQQQQQQMSSFGRSNSINQAPIGSFSTSSSSQRNQMSNGFDSRPLVSNGFNGSTINNGSSMSSFERSISGNLFDSGHANNSVNNGSFSRQMSMPSNLCDQGGVSNGFGGGNSRHMNGGGENNYRFVFCIC